MKALVLLSALAISVASSSAAPNVIFIMADDLGYMDVGFNNPNTFYDTPSLNGLAKEATLFTDAYAACPVCSPTRSSILTGQYPARTRNTDYFGAPNGQKTKPENQGKAEMEGKMKRVAKRPLLPAPYHDQLAAEHTTLAEAFKAKGYATMHAGKWHLGDEGSWPTDHGFDVNIGGTKGGGPYGGKKYFSPYGNPNLPDGPDGEHLPDRLATEVAKFITTNKDKPFFVYLPFYSVHTPLMAPKPLVNKYEAKAKKLGLEAKFDPEWPRKNRTVQQHAIYGGMVEAMDSAVGKVLKAVEDNGLKEKTIVIFFSDNGGLSTSEGSPTSNLPYRAGKGWAYEGGVREPCLVSWPGTIRGASTSSVPIISTDFYPTLLELCGFELMPEQHLDGTSFAKVFNALGVEHNREPLFWHYPHWGNQGGIPYSALRDGDWKLIRFHWKKGEELYNLAKDPGEQTNLADKEPAKLKELAAILDAKLKDTDAIMPIVNPNAAKDFEK
jgi:arylsulfatase A-like enzyme